MTSNNNFMFEKNESHININVFGLKIKFKKFKREPKEKAVAFIDCGGIGDYILLRKYLKYIKSAPKFAGYKLVYFSKAVYKDMLICYEDNIFDDIIIYGDNEIGSLKNELKKYKFEYLVSLFLLTNTNNYSLNWKTRIKLTKKINAKYKIAGVISHENYEKNKNLKFWNKLIVTEPVNFESERRRQFFEKLLEISIPEEDLSIEPIFDLKKDYIVISLFADSNVRNYSKEKWVEIINYVLQNSNKDLQLLFIGVDKDKKGAEEILKCVDDKNNRCKNLIGFTNIAILPSILSGAKLLVACETGTVHIANAVRCKTVCLSCGAYYGRYLPYNNGIVEYVFPDKFQELIDNNNQKELKKYYDFVLKDVQYPVSDIQSEKVINVLSKYLSCDEAKTSVGIEE